MTVDSDHARSGDAGGLKYLVYTSEAARKMLPADLESILFTSRKHNMETGITGALLYRNTTFIQFLEGPPAEIDALMDRIRIDDRHNDVRVLLVEAASERSFGDWKMGFGIPKETQATGVDGVRDSFTDLTGGAGYDVVRQAAEDFSIWFKVRERALPS
ncbi:BLUF domain-containing protein [Dietzia alimentaria]|uniref:BLUF domain-containing protein n=1 Tax=Dietzia alimentaria TaxID=665550 RepID=UPI00029B4E8E|nr:BLUF domain-containing protein [Dietzia alimentaria]